MLRSTSRVPSCKRISIAACGCWICMLGRTAELPRTWTSGSPPPTPSQRTWTCCRLSCMPGSSTSTAAHGRCRARRRSCGGARRIAPARCWSGGGSWTRPRLPSWPRRARRRPSRCSTRSTSGAWPRPSATWPRRPRPRLAWPRRARRWTTECRTSRPARLPCTAWRALGSSVCARRAASRRPGGLSQAASRPFSAAAAPAGASWGRAGPTTPRRFAWR
mmetsp:Transcript_60262/g.197035  ORF Transcript_60262/g.197035 Transcript_60262/m.197035 type:complete len:219 (+) Transcript_60262:568-1224(+)